MDKNICHCGKEIYSSAKECVECQKIAEDWIKILSKRDIISRFKRDARCWKCKAELSTETHQKCQVCNWIKCNCGACGCNIEEHRFSQSEF
jgi:hypothetical protein